MFQRLIAILLLSFNLSFCSSTKQASLEEVDVELKALPATEELRSVDINQLDASSVFSLQQQFKPKPSKQEQEVLINQLESLGESDFDIQRARKLRAVGRYEEAQSVYRNLIRSGKSEFYSHVELSQTLLELGEFSLAYRYLGGAKTILDAQEEPMREHLIVYKYTLAILMLASERIDEGRTLLRELINKESSFLSSYVALAGSYLKDSKFELAEFIAVRGLDLNEENADLLNVLGVCALKRNDLAKAARWLNAALEVDANHVSALTNRANLSLVRMEYDRSEQDLQKALSIYPGHSEAHIVLGLLYSRTGRFDSARDSFTAALKLSPESAYARYNLGLLLADRFNRKNDALRLFYEVLQSKNLDEKLPELARAQIDRLRDNRLDMIDSY